MTFKIPNSIRDPKDLINLFRDRETTRIGRKLYGNLPKEPEAHIATNAIERRGSGGGDTQPDQVSYYFYKVYVQSYDDGTINIYDGVNRSTEEVAFIISGYKTAYYKGTSSDRPKANEVWSCEFKTEKNTLGSIEIKSKIRNTDRQIVRQDGSVRNNGGRRPFQNNGGSQPLGGFNQPPLPNGPLPSQVPSQPSPNSSIVITPIPTTFESLNNPPFSGETIAKYSQTEYDRWTRGEGTTNTTYDNIIRQKAAIHGVSPALVKAIIWSESRFRPNVGSPVGAQGLMQLMPATAASLGVTDIKDPEQNINGGTKYIKKQLNRFGGDVELALASYNWGPGNVRSGLRTTGASTFWEMADKRGFYNNGRPKVPEETQGYVRRVTIRYEYYLYQNPV